MERTEEFDKKIGFALLQLYKLDKYLYNVAARLKILPAAALPGELADVPGYTDGARVYLTPSWLNPNYDWCTDNNLVRVTVLTHEILHIISKHSIRIANLPDINFSLMNVAADLSIAEQQRDLGMPIRIVDLVPDGDKYVGMDMFEIYKLLKPEDADKDQGHPQIGAGAKGDDDNDQGSEGQSHGLGVPTKEEEFDIDQAIQQAAVQAELEGYSTATSRAAARAVSEARAEKLPWDRYLTEVSSRLKSDLPTWTRPNRRMFSQVYLPSKIVKKEYEATIAMDVSGSVGEIPLNKIASISQDILTRYVQSLHLLTFDDKIVDEWHLTKRDKIVNLKLNGYGGTYVQKVYDHLKKNKKEPKLLIIATDGYIPDTKDPGYPVIWLIVNNHSFTSKYGKVLHINTKDLE